MESKGPTTASRRSLYRRGVYWVIGVLLLLLTLVGCLTSYAAGPPEQDQVPTSFPTITSPPPTATPTAAPSKTPRVTLVPNLAVRVFQDATSTPTATITPTATLTPTVTPSPTTPPTATLEPTDTLEPSPTREPTATPITIQPTAAPFQAYAWLDNYFPAPGSTVTVFGRLFKYGRPVNGAQMGVTWSYTHAKGYCTAYTGIDGRAACSQNIGMPLQNYWVYVDVVFIYENEKYYAKTGFLTDP
jgi:hypothetical protein